ncbi:hypothetical protein CJU94_00770 [Paraburkholderia aromaticivorans]|uniref:Uncharacterized protein n=1 Tax=Paraburkholderia aromaticivorans TaxID=2026199 RepID=A0A248VE11_9BURK|nr:hypothetical protein CJU94_00770 [Paraburkholderia aromaticivorans]
MLGCLTTSGIPAGHASYLTTALGKGCEASESRVRMRARRYPAKSGVQRRLYSASVNFPSVSRLSPSGPRRRLTVDAELVMRGSCAAPRRTAALKS